MRPSCRSRRFRSALPLSLAGLLALLACGPHSERGERTERTQEEERARLVRRGVRASAAEDVAMGISSSEARFVRNLIGFQGPESVKYDAEQDVYFVTNMTGPGSEKDGNGYISRVSAADPRSAVVFAQGGKGGVVLHAPKGAALHGDTLWVCDIDVLRGFDRRTGAPLANLDFAPLGAVQLNDVAIGPDDRIYITDTGIIMSRKGVVYKGPSRIFTVGPGARIDTLKVSSQVPWPNGIAWDSAGARWIVVTFDPFDGQVHAISRGGDSSAVLRHGSARLDGLQVLADGGIVYASWGDSSIHLLRGTQDRTLVRETPEAADFGLDTRRHHLAIPLSTLGRVQLWDIGPELRRR
jgi:hypothetical protein